MKKNLIPLLVLAVSLPLLTDAEGLLVYKPPKTGAPVTRIGGGTRDLDLSTPQIQVLAPHQIALTSKSQPVLYWYLSHAKKETIEITLTKEGIDKPLLKRQVSAIAKPGLQKIRLADYGVSLEAGEDYRWSVSAINNPENSGDIINSATLRYEAPGIPLSNVEQQAEAGYWYDALQQLIETHSPLTNDLLKQIGLEVPDL